MMRDIDASMMRDRPAMNASQYSSCSGQELEQYRNAS